MEFLPALQNGVDELKPSLFELLSEQQLAALLPPSLRYLVAVATPRYPRYLLPVLNSFDEVYALVSLLVERHFLRTYQGSLTENFYGMKRARVLRVKGGEIPRAQLGASDNVREAVMLDRSHIWKNLAVLVGLPWLKRKLDDGYDIHAAHVNLLRNRDRDRDQLPPGATIKQRLLFYYKWFLRNIYPSVNAAYYFSLLVFNMAYLFDGTKYHSPFLWLIGTRIRRLGSADHHAIELATAPRSTGPARPGEGGSIFSPRNLARAPSNRACSAPLRSCSLQASSPSSSSSGGMLPTLLANCPAKPQRTSNFRRLFSLLSLHQPRSNLLPTRNHPPIHLVSTHQSPLPPSSLSLPFPPLLLRPIVPSARLPSRIPPLHLLASSIATSAFTAGLRAPMTARSLSWRALLISAMPMAMMSRTRDGAGKRVVVRAAGKAERDATLSPGEGSWAGPKA
jgi:hypothetical protein